MAGDFPRKRWVTPSVDDAVAAALARALTVPLPVATVLAARGHTEPERTAYFLHPRLSDLADPDAMPNMAVAVARIWTAIDRREDIVIFGDYDVDGVCSATLMTLVLRALGGRVTPFLPNRLEHGYGLSVGGLTRCLEQSQPKLIITVDCGTGSTEAVRLAAARGIDVVVTDHHEPDGAPAPALAVVNPKLVDGHPAGTLAGVGVAFKVCHALVKRGMVEARPSARAIDLREYLDLVAVATVADVVPLLGENRIFVSHGLRRLNTSPRVGLRALLDSAGLRRAVDSYHIGFVIGPRLNAAGRLGGAQTALELLLTDDPRLAAERAQELEAANRERKSIEDEILTEAEAEIQAGLRSHPVFGVVVGQPGWHIGTVGIVASRLVSRFARPTVVLGLDEEGRGRGSCRSIDQLDVLEALHACADLIVKYGGHKMAAGIEIEAAKLDAFRTRFNEVCRQRLEGRDLRPILTVDAWINLAEADSQLLGALDRLRPLGAGNPEPHWGVRQVRLAAPPRRVGRDERHLKMVVAKGGSQIGAVGFNLGAYQVPDGDLDLVFQLRENWYNGRSSVELEIADMRPSDGKNVAEPAT